MSQPDGVMIYQDHQKDGYTVGEGDLLEQNYGLDIKISNEAFTDITSIPVKDNML